MCKNITEYDLVYALSELCHHKRCTTCPCKSICDKVCGSTSPNIKLDLIKKEKK